MKGLGIEYERRNRLIVTGNTVGVTFGSGDEPVKSVDELVDFTKTSVHLLTDVTRQIVEYFVRFLKENQGTKF